MAPPSSTRYVPAQHCSTALHCCPYQLKYVVPESSLYTNMLHLEHELDALLAKRRDCVAQTLTDPLTLVPKRLRVYIFNWHENQRRSMDDTGRHTLVATHLVA